MRLFVIFKLSVSCNKIPEGLLSYENEEMYSERNDGKMNWKSTPNCFLFNFNQLLNFQRGKRDLRESLYWYDKTMVE